MIYSMDPRPSWDQTVKIIKEQKTREDNRLLEYRATMGIDEKKIKVGLSTQTTTDRSPSRPCRVCGGNHWDKDCNKKKASTPTRPCQHCGGEHYDNKCPTLKRALITAKTKHKSDLSCHACGDNHKVINCPLVKFAKESIIGKKRCRGYGRHLITNSYSC